MIPLFIIFTILYRYMYDRTITDNNHYSIFLIGIIMLNKFNLFVCITIYIFSIIAIIPQLS